MVEFIHEIVSVEARLRAGGTVRPLAFSWRGRRYPVESWGRESIEKQAGRRIRSYLVQTAGSETWELCQDVQSGEWKLLRHWTRRGWTV